MTTGDPDSLRRALLTAICPHVPFDGWGPEAFDAAVRDAGIEPDAARRVCPRGAVDLAALNHRMGDAALAETLAARDTSGMRYRDRVSDAVMTRIAEAGDKEAVRRASALFALPHLAGEGAALIWGTADAIWTALGDTSRDANWYSKRAILAGVYGATVLYWLGDTSPGDAATRAFLDRRIGDVMAFEKFKADMRASKLFGPLAAGIGRLAAGVHAPGATHKSGLPGYLTGEEAQ